MSSKRNIGADVGVCSLIVLIISTPLYSYIHPGEMGVLSQVPALLLVAAAAGLTFFRIRMGAALAGRFRQRANV